MLAGAGVLPCLEWFGVGVCRNRSDSGVTTGAGNDVMTGGTCQEFVIGDSLGPALVSGSGSNDVIDLGVDGGSAAIGDHDTIFSGQTAIGAGNDTITGDCAGEGGHDTIVRCELTSVGAPGVTSAERRAVLGFTPMVDRRPRRHGN